MAPMGRRFCLAQVRPGPPGVDGGMAPFAQPSAMRAVLTFSEKNEASGFRYEKKNLSEISCSIYCFVPLKKSAVVPWMVDVPAQSFKFFY